MKSYYDIIVVGGGPAGSMAAYESAKSGCSVCLLEKDRDIGYPVRCGEAIGKSGLSQFFKPKKSWIAAEINSADLISPNGTVVSTPFTSETGYILNRRIFDYDLSRFAVQAGAEVYTKSYVKNLIYDNDYIKGVKLDYLGQEKVINSKIVIGADGINSRIGRYAGIKTNIRMKDMESCLQYSVANIDIKESTMTMYVGHKYAPGGYLWIFPKGKDFANIGIGISGKYSKLKPAVEYLNDFIANEYPDVSILTTVCGGVPCPKIMKNPISNGLLLVGDAAHQINPLTGGGISSGMMGGKIGGEVASESIKINNFSKDFLSKYSNKVYEVFGKQHDRFYRIKEASSQLSDNDIDSIAKKVLNIPIEKRNLMSIFKATVYKKPSLIIDVIRAFTGY